MASIRQKTRQKAVKQASDAMFSSIGVLSMLLPQIKSVEGAVLDFKVSSEKLTSSLINFLELETPTPLPDAVKEEDFDTVTGRIKERSFDLAKIGLLIPLLINKESREYLASFLSGLTGISIDSFKKVLTATGIVLAGVFSYKLFKQVGDTITAFKQLSTLVQTLFGITSNAASDVVVEQEGVEKEKNKVAKDKKEIEKKKAEERKAKKQARQAKQQIRQEKTKYKKLNKLGKLSFLFKKFVPIVGKSLLRAIPVVGIGLTIYAVVDEVLNFFKDEKEESKEDAERVDDDRDDQVDSEQEDSEKVEKEEDSSSQPAPSSGGPLVEQQSRSEKSSSATAGEQIDAVPATPMPTAMEPDAPNVDASSETAVETPAELELPTSITPQTSTIAESSEEMVHTKKSMSPLIVVNNIDSSTVLVKRAA